MGNVIRMVKTQLMMTEHISHNVLQLSVRQTCIWRVSDALQNRHFSTTVTQHTAHTLQYAEHTVTSVKGCLKKQKLVHKDVGFSGIDAKRCK